MSKAVISPRWSYSVPPLCYFAFLLAIWMLSVPLRPQRPQRPPEAGGQPQPEDTFEIRIKNSNFNSDRRAEAGGKSEYVVDLNDGENVNRDKTVVLMEVFAKADKDKNNKLDANELAEWIRRKIVEHITSAISNNYGLFALIDVNPRNGVITWKEYHTYFLKKRGFSTKYVQNHDERRHRGLKRAIKEQIMRDKASWLEAARSNPDSLTAEEFLGITHPESSAANQLALVDELYDKFDRDGDEFLTENEFAVLQRDGAGGDVGDGGDGGDADAPPQDQKERRAEFRRSVDLNGDGRADRRELLQYVAPQSPRHSEHEAEALLALADADRDRCLSPQEILAHPDLFLRSKMVDTARSFHDEF